MIKYISTVFYAFIILTCNGQKTNNCQDFDKLKSHKVIAFGEASHGSYSDYKARIELIKCLIKDGDTISVLIEMPHATGIAIQKYYSGEIDEDSLIKEARYYGLRTNAFLELINEFKGNEQVSFQGFDMQLQQSTLVYLKESIKAIKPNLEISPMIDSLNQNFLFDYSDSLYLSYLPVISRNLNLLKSTLAKEGLLVNENFLTIQYPLQIVEQHFHMLVYAKPLQNFKYVVYRDSCMAENVILLNHYLGKQSIVLAANSHVMLTTQSNFVMMGGHLKQYYEDDYFIIVSQYKKGKLLVSENVEGQRAIIEKNFTAYKTSIPSKLNKLLPYEHDTLLLISQESGRIKRLFSRKRLGYDMGAGFGNNKKSGLIYFYPANYDAIYYIPNVLPSIYKSKE